MAAPLGRKAYLSAMLRKAAKKLPECADAAMELTQVLCACTNDADASAFGKRITSFCRQINSRGPTRCGSPGSPAP